MLNVAAQALAASMGISEAQNRDLRLFDVFLGAQKARLPTSDQGCQRVGSLGPFNLACVSAA
jgi:hypothetical protein